MRRVVFVEGQRLENGLTVAIGALTPRHSETPVIFQFGRDQTVGIAREFQRNGETGELSFDIQLDLWRDHVVGSTLAIDCSALITVTNGRLDDDGNMVILAGRIDAVNVAPTPYITKDEFL